MTRRMDPEAPDGFPVRESHLPGRLGVSRDDVRKAREKLLVAHEGWCKKGRRVFLSENGAELLRLHFTKKARGEGGVQDVPVASQGAAEKGAGENSPVGEHGASEGGVGGLVSTPGETNTEQPSAGGHLVVSTTGDDACGVGDGESVQEHGENGKSAPDLPERGWMPRPVDYADQEVLTVVSGHRRAPNGRHFGNARIVHARRENGEVVTVQVRDSKNFAPTDHRGVPMVLAAVPGDTPGVWTCINGRMPRQVGRW